MSRSEQENWGRRGRIREKAGNHEQMPAGKPGKEGDESEKKQEIV